MAGSEPSLLLQPGTAAIHGSVRGRSPRSCASRAPALSSRSKLRPCSVAHARTRLRSRMLLSISTQPCSSFFVTGHTVLPACMSLPSQLARMQALGPWQGQACRRARPPVRSQACSDVRLRVTSVLRSKTGSVCASKCEGLSTQAACACDQSMHSQGPAPLSAWTRGRRTRVEAMQGS